MDIEKNMRQLIGALLFIYILILSWTGSAEALGTFTCSSPCVNGDSQVGNGSATSNNMTISNAVAGRPILVFTRGGLNSSSVSVINKSGPATLNWTLLTSLSPAFASDWVFAVHCAMVPNNGTYTFQTSNNTSGGTASDRTWSMQLNAGTCSGALTNIHTQHSGSPTSSSITISSGTYVVATGSASDGDIDTAQGNTTRSISGGTVVNSNCNTTGSGAPEPDQKGCIGVIGLKTAGTYNATWSTGTDIWTVAIVALPTSGGGDTTPPTPPTNLRVVQ